MSFDLLFCLGGIFFATLGLVAWYFAGRDWLVMHKAIVPCIVRERDPIPDRVLCNCCRRKAAVCDDLHVGKVCGECKAELVVAQFNMTDIGFDECAEKQHRKEAA